MIKYGIFIQGGESMKKVISLVLATLLCAAVFVGCGGNEDSSSVSSSVTTSAETSSKSTQETVSKMEKIPTKGEVFSASPDECAKIINLYLVEPSPIVLGERVTGETASWKDYTISEHTDITFFEDETGENVKRIMFNCISAEEYPEKNFQDYFMATIMAIDPKMTSEKYANLCLELRFGFPRSTEEGYTVNCNGFTYYLSASEYGVFVSINPQK